MATDTVTRGTKNRRSRQNAASAATPAAAAPAGAPVPVPGAEASVAPVRTRRSWGYGAGALAAIIVGGLIGAFVYTGTQHTDEVWVVRSDVPRGQTITAQDLAVINVAHGQHTAGFTGPAAKDRIIGKIAIVDLPGGSLVTEKSIAATLPVPAGKSLVGIALKTSQVPSVPLHAGDKVVITPIAQQAGTISAGAQKAGDVDAIIATDPKPDSASGTVVVNVYVTASRASDVAGRAAGGQVTLYLDSGE
jgi:hypothetical protein